MCALGGSNCRDFVSIASRGPDNRGVYLRFFKVGASGVPL